MDKEKLYDFINNHIGSIAGAVIGIFLALIFIVFGFIRGLLVLVFLIGGIYLGSYWDSGERPPSPFDRFLPPRK